MGCASQQLSQLVDDGSLSLCVWHIFSYVLPCFRLSLPDSILKSFQNISTFLISKFFPCFLVGFLPLFMSERVSLRQAVR
jgi:hypothetical protein